MDNKIRLLLGLGNPGRKYRFTRHNIGYLVIDRLLSEVTVEASSENSLCWWAKVEFARQSLILAKPLTYMNLSGEAALWLANHFSVSPFQTMLIHDDLDLPWGRLKLIKKGGSGGHKGVLSVQQSLQTTEIPRLKIGIGRPVLPENVIDYVLTEFSPSEKKTLDLILSTAINAIKTALETNLERAMSTFNKKDLLPLQAL